MEQKMVDWKLVNKLRLHNRNETIKHFMVKAMVFKLLFNEGNYIYSEYNICKDKKWRVADVLVKDKNNVSKTKIVVEIETKPTKKHNKELMEFYKEETLYIIDTKEISDNLIQMRKQIKHILGL